MRRVNKSYTMYYAGVDTLKVTLDPTGDPPINIQFLTDEVELTHDQLRSMIDDLTEVLKDRDC